MLGSLFRKFKNNEEGAVTVDWVVLTAAIILMTIGLLTVFQGAMSDSGDSLNASISNSVASLLS